MLAFQVLGTLWALLNTRKRLIFCALIGLLFVAGLAEMGGMMVIFGYVGGLKLKADGSRGGPVARAIDILLDSAPTQTEYAIWGGAFVVFFILGKNTLSALIQFGLTRFLMKTNQTVTKRLLEGYLLAPFRQIKRLGPKKLQRQVKGSFTTLLASFSAVAQILADMATLFMVGILLLFVSPVLTLSAALIFGVIGTGLYALMHGWIRGLAAKVQESTKEGDRLLSEAFGGIVDTRLRFAHSLVVSKYSRALGKRALFTRRLTGMRRLPRSTNEVLLTSMIVGSVTYLTLLRGGVEDALPTLALFGFAGMRLTGAMSRLNTSTQKLRQNQRQFQAAVALLEKQAPDLFTTNSSATPQLGYLGAFTKAPETTDPRSFEEIRFENVGYAFQDRQGLVVEGVSLSIRKGQFVSFCGPSGGGKSTLLLLAMGLVNAKVGSVCVNGIETARLVKSWHEMIGYVGQDIFLTSGTVRENVAFAVEGQRIDDDRVWGALEQASAKAFVSELPEGLDTPLLGGSELSGGQKQRIAIARALYRNPSVIVLDEATAALDNMTEREVADSVLSMSEGKTVICVAHRLSTIRQSDIIHYIESGKILASGTYEELLADCQAFRKMVQASSLDGESGEA